MNVQRQTCSALTDSRQTRKTGWLTTRWTPTQLALVFITLGAAIVNGALGYGFSSITVPIALLFLTNRVLNPALVPIEVALNAYVLWVNRDALPRVWRRVLPIVDRAAAGRDPRHGDRVAGQPGLAQVRHVHRAAAADPVSGRRVSPADQVRAVGRPRVRRRRRRALFGDDDLGTAAGGDAEQPGTYARETSARRSASSGWRNPASPRSPMRYAGLYTRAEHGAHPVHPAEHRDRRTDWRARHPAHATRRHSVACV